MTAGFCRQLQSRTGGLVSTTVTVWLHDATVPQSSLACQVRVITCGHEPLVTVVTPRKTTPLPGVPGCGQQALVGVGGLKFHVVPHSTVLFGAQISANG